MIKALIQPIRALPSAATTTIVKPFLWKCTYLNIAQSILPMVSHSVCGVLPTVALPIFPEWSESRVLKGCLECLRSTPGISTHNIVFSFKNIVFFRKKKSQFGFSFRVYSKINVFFESKYLLIYRYDSFLYQSSNKGFNL